ncbi:hypothetical protein [Cryobacterium sp. M25]|uniref:hypothetical protein n=1 Tax=Cryobacterium sp. M25 TaxID=2048293 RepID=UPI0035154943
MGRSLEQGDMTARLLANPVVDRGQRAFGDDHPALRRGPTRLAVSAVGGLVHLAGGTTSSSRWRSPGRPEPRRGIRCLGPTDAAAHPPRPSNQFDGDFEDGALSQRGLNRFEQNLRRIRSGRRAPRARRALSSPTSRSRGPARRASSG